MNSNAREKFDALMGAGDSSGVVPQWVKDLAVEEDGEILSLEDLRRLLGNLGCSLSDEIIIERYGPQETVRYHDFIMAFVDKPCACRWTPPGMKCIMCRAREVLRLPESPKAIALREKYSRKDTNQQESIKEEK